MEVEALKFVNSTQSYIVVHVYTTDDMLARAEEEVC